LMGSKKLQVREVTGMVKLVNLPRIPCHAVGHTLSCRLCVGPGLHVPVLCIAQDGPVGLSWLCSPPADLWP
jgi:hypothetical protein